MFWVEALDSSSLAGGGVKSETPGTLVFNPSKPEIYETLNPEPQLTTRDAKAVDAGLMNPFP